MKFKFLVFIFCFMVSFSAQQKKALEPKDLYDIVGISEPRISPDGNWVVFTTTVPNLDSNNSNSDLWLMTIEGENLIQLTSAPGSNKHPKWFPDSKRIAFISDRFGTDEILEISISGGEAKRLTNSNLDFSNFVISSSGNKILAKCRIIPEGKSEIENWTKDELPLSKAKTIDHLLFRQWDEWLGDERNQLFVIDAVTGEAFNSSDEDADVPPVSLTSSHDYDISPDGSEICYVKNIDTMLAISTNHDLFIKNLKTLEEVKITANKAKDSQPHYSPDGKYIAYTSMVKPGYEADTEVLTLFDRKTKDIKRITQNLDLSVEEIVWSSDSKTIYFNTFEKGRCNIFRTDLEGNIERLTSEGYDIDLQVSPKEKVLVFSRSFNHIPYEIYKMDLATKEVVQITNFNKEFLARIELPELEDFWFEGANGDSVHGFLQKPPMFDPAKKYPVVLTIHGGPQNMWADRLMTRWFTFPLISSPGYVGVFINPRGSKGYGAKFREEVSRDYGGKAYEDLMLGLDYAIEKFNFIDADKQAAIGGSFGGYMINWILGHTDRFKCTVSHASLYNLISFYGSTEELWYPAWDMGETPWNDKEILEKWSPHNFAANFKTPTLVTHGMNDFRVNFAESLQLFTALQRQSVDSKLVVFPDDAHVIYKYQNNVRWWKEIHKWFEIYLK